VNPALQGPAPPVALVPPVLVLPPVALAPPVALVPPVAIVPPVALAPPMLLMSAESGSEVLPQAKSMNTRLSPRILSGSLRLTFVERPCLHRIGITGRNVSSRETRGPAELRRGTLAHALVERELGEWLSATWTRTGGSALVGRDADELGGGAPVGEDADELGASGGVVVTPSFHPR